MLNDIKENIKLLYKMTTLNVITIQLQDTQISNLISGRYPPLDEELPNYTMADSDNEK